MSNRLEAFQQAVQLTVEGDEVALTSIAMPEGEEFHVTPRKYSKKNAAKLRRLMMNGAASAPASLQAKIRKLKAEYGDELNDEILSRELTDDDVAAISNTIDPEGQYEVERAKILYGIARQDFTDEPGPMTEQVADLILESRKVSDEVLALIDGLNPPFGQETSS